jgi:hypothetical protein
MKKLITILLIASFSGSATAQITITNADMPNTGDTLRVSEASVLTPVDLSLTGANFTWDFSGLLPVAQDIDTFVSVGSTPTLLAIYFVNLSINTNRANIAALGTNNPLAAQLPVSDVYSFFYENSSLFQQVGFGATIGGTGVPLGYGNKDIIYNFPLNFNDQDSSNSDYSLSVPGTVYAEGNQKRVNFVDGWGSLTTPYGTFNALRMKSTLTGQDSVYLDSTATGFSTARPLIREYKWLANGERIPVLQINTAEVFGVEAISSIRYRDSLRVNVGLPPVSALQTNPVLFPNPNSGENVFAMINLVKPAAVKIDICAVDGHLVNSSVIQLSAGVQNIAIRSSDLQLDAGVYMVRFLLEGEAKTVKMVVRP